MHENSLRNALIAVLIALTAIIAAGMVWFFVGATGVPTGLGWYMFSFAAGLTMIVLPCTLPLAFVIVPLVMKKGLLKGIGIAVAFGLGITLTLGMYGVLASLVGQVALGTLEAPLETVKNWVYFIAGIFALLFALGEIGLIKVRMPSYTGAAPAFIQKRGDYVKALLLGLFLGNIGVGCPHPATPLILIEIASSGNILYGWSLFLVHAIGRVLPLLFLAFLALVGVNGLSWLVSKKDKIEQATGWAMVFVAGFILTLGLFTHDWYVNSGIHTWFESITQEARFTEIIRDNLDSSVTHSHGLQDGTGLFGLPLWLGNWTLVFLWVFPIWWWWAYKRKELHGSVAFRLERLQAHLDTLESERRSIETEAHLEELTKTTAIEDIQKRMDALESERRKAEEEVHYGEEGSLKDPVARKYEKLLLFAKRNFFFVLTLLLALVFIHVLPQNFLQQAAMHPSTSSGQVPTGTPFSQDVRGLPPARVPQVVELNDGDTYDLVASIVAKEVGNRTVRMLAYNGSIPGPLLKVRQGATITINFRNETDVETTVHSHGLRLDNRFDGVPNVSQDPIPPGKSFTYTVTFPDAGVYWYHPHIREDYAQELGLYGNYLVVPSDADYYSPVNREVPLIVDDILFKDDKPHDDSVPSPWGKLEPFYREFTNFALLGRFGNEFLVNGETDFILSVERGEVVRFPITNVANTRVFNLSIPGARMKLVGADVGKYEREQYVNNILLSPGERAVIEVFFENPGLHKLVHTTPDGLREIGYISVGSVSTDTSYAWEFDTLRTNDELEREIAALEPYVNGPVDKNLLLSVDLGMGATMDHAEHTHTSAPTTATDGHDHAHTSSRAAGQINSMGGMMSGSGIQWDDPDQSERINTTQNVTWKIIDRDTGKANMDIDWRFEVGEYVKIRVENDAIAAHVMQHPIHFHGQRFLILSRNNIPEANRAWKDTALVVPGEAMEILVEMSNPGEWMAHCHIAEHLHAGMMFGFRVEEEDGSAPGDDYRASVGFTRTSTRPIGEEAVTSGSRVRNVREGAERTVEAGVPTSFTFSVENLIDGAPHGDGTEPSRGASTPSSGRDVNLRVFGIRETGDESFVIYPTESTTRPGVYIARHRFERGGTYRIWTALDQSGASRVFEHDPLIVLGETGSTPKPPTYASNVIVGDYQVSIAHEALRAGAPTIADIVVTDVFGGGVALEPFEGDALQVDLVAQDFHHYMHEHPMPFQPMMPSDMPHEDGHTDHTHSLLDFPAGIFAEVAHAHGTIEGALDASTVYRTTITPVSNGTYRLFVHFRPANVGLPAGRFLTAVFDIKVPSEAVGTLAQTNAAPTTAPWYQSTRWWVLLVTSLVLMTILSLGVKRYLAKE
jgi:FtsP/CotA-like multicopper oxidase with cupredoxin domain/cytochrome c biogenesis protein CcdA